jgi:hypothetical protein
MQLEFSLNPMGGSLVIESTPPGIDKPSAQAHGCRRVPRKAGPRPVGAGSGAPLLELPRRPALAASPDRSGRLLVGRPFLFQYKLTHQ